MSCTCSKKKLPCPIHGEKGLPIPETVEHSVFVIRVYQRKDDSWFTEIVKDSIKVFEGSDRKNQRDAMLESICKLTNLTG